MSKLKQAILSGFHQRLAFDRAALQGETLWLIGVDEVGRGPLAGPVVAAAVALSVETLQRWQASPPESLLRVNDSKKLTASERQRLSEALLSTPDVFCAQGWLSAQDVDRLNIHHATLEAMAQALHSLILKLPPDQNGFILIDGKWPIPPTMLEEKPSILSQWSQKTVIQGDGKSLSIAAASIIAKHHRDAWMIALGENYPDYGWAKNKGYGTVVHRNALARLGATPWHRQTFLKKLLGNPLTP